MTYVSAWHRLGLVAACAALHGCGIAELWDRAVGDEDVAEHDDRGEAVEPEGRAASEGEVAAAGSPADRSAERSGLGAAIAGAVSGDPPPSASTQAPVESLEVLEGVSVEAVSAAWKLGEASRYGPTAPEFLVEATLKATTEPAFAQVRYWAKASCEIEPGERRTSAFPLSLAASAGGYYGEAVLEVGQATSMTAALFPVQDAVGHYPCEISFRAASAAAKTLLALPGTWCTDGETTTTGPCSFAPKPASRGRNGGARDWAVSKDRRSILVTLDFPDRVRLDRELVVRSACDDGAGLVVQSQTASATAPWGVFGPGDSYRLELAQYPVGWFLEDYPCEISLEWWRRRDDGGRSDPETIAVACMPKFLIEPGTCGFEAAVEAPEGTPQMTVAKFEPTVSGSGGRDAQVEVTLDLMVNRSVMGDQELRVTGSCAGSGRGARAQQFWFSSNNGSGRDILKAGEHVVDVYRGWMGGALRQTCTITAELVSLRGIGSVEIAKACIGRGGAKPC